MFPHCLRNKLQGRSDGIFFLPEDIPSCKVLSAGGNSFFTLLLLPITVGPLGVPRECSGSILWRCPSVTRERDGHHSGGPQWHFSEIKVFTVLSCSLLVNPSAIFWGKEEYALTENALTHLSRVVTLLAGPHPQKKRLSLGLMHM